LINVTLWLDKSGCLYGIDASGHSGSAAKGKDIICSAVSTLLRTVSRLLEIEPSVELVGSVEDPGELHLSFNLLEESKSEWLWGVSSFALLGLKDLEAEHPSFCRIHLVNSDPDIIEIKE
jgi:uncharacterized protein YsxB (DUF464 family)